MHASAGRRPLCRFPTASLEADPQRLSPEIRRCIEREHHGWDVGQGMCAQCRDLYEATRSDLAIRNLRHMTNVIIRLRRLR